MKLKITLDKDELKQIVVDHLLKLGWTTSADAVAFMDNDDYEVNEIADLTAVAEGIAKPTTPDGATHES